jgi:hypothetical protein
VPCAARATSAMLPEVPTAPVGRLARVVRHLAGGRALLFHCGCNRCGNVVALMNDVAHRSKRSECAFSVRLDPCNLRLMSSVGLAVWFATSFSSLATTAKPFPA